jgi:hypothetical protein
MISLLFAALYLGAVIMLHRSCAPVNQVVRLVREMISRRTSSDSSLPLERTTDQPENLQPTFSSRSQMSDVASRTRIGG